MAIMNTVLLEERVCTLVENMLKGGPIFLVEFSVRGTQGSHVIDIFVESDDTLGVNQLAELNREIGFILDTEEIMPGRYTLNVSTPGAKRRLRLPRQYRKHLGRKLRVHYRKENDAFTETCGELVAVEESHIQIQNGTQSAEIPHGDIQWAKVQLPW